MVFIPRWERHRDKKPSGAVEVDWSHELVDAIRRFDIFNADIDLVSNQKGINHNSVYSNGNLICRNGAWYDTGDSRNFNDITVVTQFKPDSLPSTSGYTGIVHKDANFQIDWDHLNTSYTGAFAAKVGGSWPLISYNITNTDIVSLAGTIKSNTRMAAFKNGKLLGSSAIGAVSPDSNSIVYCTHTVVRTGTVDAELHYVMLFDKALEDDAVISLQENPYQIIKPRRRWFVFGAGTSNTSFLNSYSSYISNRNKLVLNKFEEVSNTLNLKTSRSSDISSKSKVFKVDETKIGNNLSIFKVNNSNISNSEILNTSLDLKISSKTENVIVNISNIESKIISKIADLFNIESLIVLNSSNTTILSNSTLSSVVTFGKTLFIDSKLSLNISENIESSSLEKNKKINDIPNDNKIKLLFVNTENIDSKTKIKKSDVIELDSLLSYKALKIIRMANMVSGSVFSSSYNLPFDSKETGSILKTLILSNASVNNVTSYTKLFHIDNKSLYNVINTIQNDSTNTIHKKDFLSAESILKQILNEIITSENIEKVQGLRNFDIRNIIKNHFNLDLDVNNLENILKPNVFSFYNKELKDIGFQCQLSNKETSVIESKILQINNYYGERFGFDINISNITGFIHNGYFVIENFDNIIFIPLRSDSSIWILDSQNNTWEVDIKNNSWSI